MPQAFDGLALGSAFVRANFGWKKYCSLAVVFVLITPIGIAIGIGVSKSYAPGSKAALGTEAAFNSFSAGESSSHPLLMLSSKWLYLPFIGIYSDNISFAYASFHPILTFQAY